MGIGLLIEAESSGVPTVVFDIDRLAVKHLVHHRHIVQVCRKLKMLCCPVSEKNSGSV